MALLKLTLLTRPAMWRVQHPVRVGIEDPLDNNTARTEWAGAF